MALLSSKSVAVLVLATAIRCSTSFVYRTDSLGNAASARARLRRWSLQSTTTTNGIDVANADTAFALAVSSDPPSWESLESHMPKIDFEEPVVTLYRDTNGWCPFCERAWLAIRAKGIPYQETLISLQNKPQWYKQMVPTTLVPAVLFHGSAESTDRKLVWESSAILHELDDMFPSVQLMRTGDDDFDAAVRMHENLQGAGIQFVYGSRNQTLTEEEKVDRRKRFESALNDLDAALGQQKGGDFRMGKEFSGLDCLMIPTLERWRYQLPVTEGVDILNGRENIRNWFSAMEAFPPYSDRVAGDEYSWTAVSSTFLRYFGGGEDKPMVASGIRRADAAAEELASRFVDNVFEGGREMERKFSSEAASKLLANHEAIVADCTRQDPASQKHLLRATKEDVADKVLRYTASLLIASAVTDGDMSAVDIAKSSSLVDVSDPTEGALALRTVATRLCVPRDMGAPAASILRGVLCVVADRLER